MSAVPTPNPSTGTPVGVVVVVACRVVEDGVMTDSVADVLVGVSFVPVGCGVVVKVSASVVSVDVGLVVGVSFSTVVWVVVDRGVVVVSTVVGVEGCDGDVDDSSVVVD